MDNFFLKTLKAKSTVRRNGFISAGINLDNTSLEGEEETRRAVLHKSSITVDVNLVALGKTQWYNFRNVFFNGKKGCWPLVERVDARQSSRNRLARTSETMSHSVSKESNKKLVLNLGIPAVRDKFPSHRFQVVVNQHDDASSQSIAEDNEVLVACNDAPPVKIELQPRKQPKF